jgi:hypothetical protein
MRKITFGDEPRKKRTWEKVGIGYKNQNVLQKHISLVTKLKNNIFFFCIASKSESEIFYGYLNFDYLDTYFI